MALSPITRQEIHRLAYGDVVPLVRTRNLEFDDSREVFVVAVSAQWRSRGGGMQPTQTCNSFFVVFDAPTGRPLAAGCGGQQSWPDRLPPAFSKP